jgi:hypothetical protein
MAQLGGTFDANQVDPAGTYEVLPPGDYKVQIVQSDMMNTKNGNGQYLWLEMDIVDGEYQGRKVWDRLNLVNPNQQAQEIAQKQLSAICHAIGVLSVQDSEELHFKPLIARVKVRQRQDTGENTNDVSGYKPLDGQQPAPAAGQQKSAPAQGAQQKPTGSVPPWKQKASA